MASIDEAHRLSDHGEQHEQETYRQEMDESEDPEGSSLVEGQTAAVGRHGQLAHPPVSFVEDDDTEETQEPAVDPAWGIQRTDSTAILQTVHRTASFPRPVSPNPTGSNENERLVGDQKELTEDPSSNEITASTLPDSVLPLSFDEQSPDAEDTMIGTSEAPEAAILEQERFEEGLPLFPSDTAASEEQTSVSQTRRLLTEADADATEDADFFTQLEEPLTDPVRVNIQRKDTDRVLQSMGMDDSRTDSPPPPTSADSKVQDLDAALSDLPDTFSDLVNNPSGNTWDALLADDGDGFLLEDDDDLLPDSDEDMSVSQLSPVLSQNSAILPQRPTTNRYEQPNSNYTPHQPNSSDMSFPNIVGQTKMGLRRDAPPPPFQPMARPNITERAPSFVDQQKGGYKSPYDMPLNLAPKPKARPQRVQSITRNVAPPPRSSSMSSDNSLQSPPFTTNQPPARASGFTVRSPVQTGSTSTARAKTSSGFFEELPVLARTRPSSSIKTQAATAALGVSHGPPSASSLTNTTSYQQKPFSMPQQTERSQYAASQLQPDLNAQPGLQPPVPAASNSLPSRYSPAPSSQQNGTKPSPSPRYSPAPPSVPGPRYSPAPPSQNVPSQSRYAAQTAPAPAPAVQPFLPRTSSPLAQQRRSVDEQVHPDGQLFRNQSQHTTSASVPFAATLTPTSMLSPPRNDPTKQPGFIPPRRSQTQSPSRQLSKANYAPRIAASPNRPQSAIGRTSPTRAAVMSASFSTASILPTIPARSLYADADYIRPQDEMQADPLQRWKGSSLLRFSFNGNFMTTFPVCTPRFTTGVVRPQVKVNPGEIKIQATSTVMPIPEHVAKFPGPLKGKAKKKELLAWMDTYIGALDGAMASSNAELSRRTHEKILLWKIVRVLIEHDGSLENRQALTAVNALLMPDVHGLDDATATQYKANTTEGGIYRPANMIAKTESTDPLVVERLRRTLLRGGREDAVWQAVDARLWSHALLIASTLDRAIWRSVVQEFVKQEVKTIGANSESLCSFYEVLAGNHEESIDQLVPPSARAGLQMVNITDSAGPIRNALEGLDKWRETLCLVLNNRTAEDQKSLMSLARLLSDYGRVEASHICLLFARSTAMPTLFGGVDDSASSIVLLGADHRSRPMDFHRDGDAVLLTEAYEFAVSTLSNLPTSQMAHLAVYKLQRATELSEIGLRTEAQAYCDAISSSIQSSTKRSIYYHPALLEQVQDLSSRLKQVPVISQSWIAKPSIEKVSGSFLKKVNNFITGEDSDAESTRSAREAAEAGPLGKLNGSPSISRNTSQSDLYGSHPAPIAVANTAAGSRYAPSSSDFGRNRYSIDQQRSPPSTSYGYQPAPGLYAPTSNYSTIHSPLGTSPSTYEYQPSAEPPRSYSLPEQDQELSQAPYGSNLDSAQIDTEGPVQPTYGGYIPVESAIVSRHDVQQTEEDLDRNGESEQPSYGMYAPPEDTGYRPYEPEPDSDSDGKPAPKKSIMDDEDDMPHLSSVSNGRSSTHDADATAAAAAKKKAHDEAADAAFRAAAEADAAREKDNASQNSNKKASGSWLGGWFGGKSSATLDSDAAKQPAGKIHRAKLGESKMKLYYDKEKGKWINPDNPDAGEKKTTAPPPRSATPGSGPPMAAGPPRSMSSSLAQAQSEPVPPVPFLGSRTGTPMSNAVESDTDSRPGTSGGPGSSISATLGPNTSASLGISSSSTSAGPPRPPSRPASASSAATGLDDLLGGPSGAGGNRRASGRAARGGKKGRYVDVMAK